MITSCLRMTYELLSGLNCDCKYEATETVSMVVLTFWLAWMGWDRPYLKVLQASPLFEMRKLFLRRLFKLPRCCQITQVPLQQLILVPSGIYHITALRLSSSSRKHKGWKSENMGSNCVIVVVDVIEPQPSHLWNGGFHSTCFRALERGSNKINDKRKSFLTRKHLQNVSWLNIVPSQEGTCKTGF